MFNQCFPGNKEEQMSKTTKIIVGIIAAILIGSFALLLSVATCGLFSAIALPAYLKTVNKMHEDEEIKLKKILEISMRLYEINEGKTPEKFSDFVVSSGRVEPPYTYSFKDFNNLTEPPSPVDLDSTKLKVTFQHGVVAEYVLKPPDIEMKRICD